MDKLQFGAQLVIKDVSQPVDQATGALTLKFMTVRDTSVQTQTLHVNGLK